MIWVDASQIPIMNPHSRFRLSTTSRRRRVIILFLFAFAISALLFKWSRQVPWPTKYVQSLESVQLPVVSLEEGPRPTVALTSLGLGAEEAYNLGSLSPSEYRSFLESFINLTFPNRTGRKLVNSLDFFLNFESMDPLPEIPKIIWQTDEFAVQDRNARSWKMLNEEHDYRFLNDEDADDWIRRTFRNSPIEWVWDFLPHPVMKADLLRYLVLLVEGGIYSDADTVCLKPISRWGYEPTLQGQIREGPPSAIVGIETDVGETFREDWHKWWSWPIQLVQWTIAFSPGHPVLLDAVRRIYARSIQYREKIQSQKNKNSPSISEMAPEWTGPAVFTDAMLRYSYLESGLRWPDLRGLKVPLRTKSVTYLPVTGFSPGVGNFGAEARYSKQAMVYHQFRGSWKPRKGRRP